MRKSADSPIGLYLHIPFCRAKCSYCDFYSGFASADMLDRYTKRLESAVKNWGGYIGRPVDTVYIGGGTPSLLGERTASLLESVYNSFEVKSGAEITLEANPEGLTEEGLTGFLKAGVNRLSIGVQSGSDAELRLLGRRHTALDAAKAFAAARKAGFKNISLDLMLGLPSSSTETLKESLDFLCGMRPEHISAYILKVEPKTALYGNSSLAFADDDEQARQYLFACEYLKKAGYLHYEISNFCRENYESRHNLKYWRCEEYLGIGPAAHSFTDGKRFFYPRDLKGFLNGGRPVFDGEGGDMREYIMLRLRLCDGINFLELEKRFGVRLPRSFADECRILAKAGFMRFDGSSAALTEEGMLLSNAIIGRLTEYINIS